MLKGLLHETCVVMVCHSVTDASSWFGFCFNSLPSFVNKMILFVGCLCHFCFLGNISVHHCRQDHHVRPQPPPGESILLPPGRRQNGPGRGSVQLCLAAGNEWAFLKILWCVCILNGIYSMAVSKLSLCHHLPYLPLLSSALSLLDGCRHLRIFLRCWVKRA